MRLQKCLARTQMYSGGKEGTGEGSLLFNYCSQTQMVPEAFYMNPNKSIYQLYCPLSFHRSKPSEDPVCKPWLNARNRDKRFNS
ncbi:Hypothetical predicted protein [Podarcis lilfordi]|uniref:Uncharacterized protein n=1 Tax=Podarcis lilfordi TaxID=74358 RepID=A0AA35K5X8_9SAUR|nr:Hypothetical predicted protein [Podarcis lilfordi]